MAVSMTNLMGSECFRQLRKSLKLSRLVEMSIFTGDVRYRFTV